MSSKRTILSRPRTRLYNANYNIGESYYKSALDRLDRKYSGRPLTPPRQTTPYLEEATERHARVFGDEDLDFSRKRAEKTIREDNLFDARSSRVSRAAILAEKLESDFDEETIASARRLRAQKKVSQIDDIDLEGTSNVLKTHRMLGRADKILDSVGINERSARRILEDDVDDRRALRVHFNGDSVSHSDDLCKWSPLEKNVTIKARKEEIVAVATADSGAAFRAKQTKNRLNDLEEEMAAISEKQAAREARISRLKKMVAETEAESADFEVSQTRAERASARKERLNAIEF